MNRRVWSLIWWTSGFICPKINCKLNERIFIFTQNEKNCISPNVDVNPYFPQLSHPLESLSISLFNQKLPSKNHKLKYFKMKLSLIFLAAIAAGQTTTWEPTTTTMFTTKADDWCGRHHDTLESFTRQVCLKSGIFDTGFSNGSVSKWTDIEMYSPRVPVSRYNRENNLFS